MANEPEHPEQGESEAGVPRMRRQAPAVRLARKRKSVENRIDEFMMRMGCMDPAAQKDEFGWRWFEYKDAVGRAGVVVEEDQDSVFLRVESLVAQLPSEPDQALAIMRNVLEANLAIAGTPRFGLDGENIFVAVNVPLMEVVTADVPGYIHSVMSLSSRVRGMTTQAEAAEDTSDG